MHSFTLRIYNIIINKFKNERFDNRHRQRYRHILGRTGTLYSFRIASLSLYLSISHAFVLFHKRYVRKTYKYKKLLNTKGKTPTCPLFILLDFLSDNSICWPNYTFQNFTLNNMNLNIFVGGVLWFLISLWSIHLIYTIGNHFGGKYAYIFYTIITIAGIVLSYNNIKLQFYLSQTMLMLPYFLLGNIFNQKVCLKEKTLYEHLSSYGIISRPFLIAIIIYFIPCDFMDVNGPVIPNILQFFITPLSGIIIVLILSRSFSILWKSIMIDKLGKNSLQILGIHAPFVPLIWTISIPILIKSFR